MGKRRDFTRGALQGLRESPILLRKEERTVEAARVRKGKNREASSVGSSFSIFC